MSKLFAIVTAALFAAVSFNSMAASHAGAPGKDDKKMEKKKGEVKTKDGKKVESKQEKKK